MNKAIATKKPDNTWLFCSFLYRYTKFFLI